MTVPPTHNALRFQSAVVTLAALTGNLRTLWSLAVQKGSFDNCKGSSMKKMLATKKGTKANLAVRFYKGICRTFKELDP